MRKLKKNKNETGFPGPVVIDNGRNMEPKDPVESTDLPGSNIKTPFPPEHKAADNSTKNSGKGGRQ